MLWSLQDIWAPHWCSLTSEEESLVNRGIASLISVCSSSANPESDRTEAFSCGHVYLVKDSHHCRNFREMYDAGKFIHSLSGVVNVADQLPAEVAAQMPSLVRVPHGVSEDFITQNIKPIFQTSHYLRLASYFTSVDWRRREKRNGDLDSTACLAMFGSLELKQGIAEAADGVVDRLRTLSRNIGSRFIAIDLRSDALEKRGCKESDGRSKACYGARETAEFLRRIGFNGDNPIYVTQTRWDESLDPLREFFPRSYTKVSSLSQRLQDHTAITAFCFRGVAGRSDACGEERWVGQLRERSGESTWPPCLCPKRCVRACNFWSVLRERGREEDSFGPPGNGGAISRAAFLRQSFWFRLELCLQEEPRCVLVLLLTPFAVISSTAALWLFDHRKRVAVLMNVYGIIKAIVCQK